MNPQNKLTVILVACLIIACTLNVKFPETHNAESISTLLSTNADNDIGSENILIESLKGVDAGPSQQKQNSRDSRDGREKESLSKKISLRTIQRLEEDPRSLDLPRQEAWESHPHLRNDVDVSGTNPVAVGSVQRISELAKIPVLRSTISDVQSGPHYLKPRPSIKEDFFAGAAISKPWSRRMEVIQQTESQKLTGSDLTTQHFRDCPLDISGEYIIFSAINEDKWDPEPGAAYVFQRDVSGNFVEVAKITSSSTSDDSIYEQYGFSIAMSGDYLIISAPSSETAYIFEKDMSGNWKEVAKLVASDDGVRRLFGISVDISGDHVIIGAHYDNYEGSFTGSAYVFERSSSGEWIEVAKLTASDGDKDADFGRSVAISGNHIIIGAAGKDSAYVFERNSSGIWSEVAKLTSSNVATRDFFGNAVDISGDYVILSAPGDSEKGDYRDRTGAAYIFERDASGNWLEVSKLTKSDRAPGDHFGESVAISGRHAIIGATPRTKSGSAHVFKRDNFGNWEEVFKLVAGDGVAGDSFGCSVAMSGDRAVVSKSQGYYYVFDIILVPDDDIWGTKFIYDTVQDLVKEKKLKATIGGSLSKKIKKTEYLLEKKRTKAAIRRLVAFKRQVHNKMTKKRIDGGTGNDLIAMADAAISKIQG